MELPPPADLSRICPTYLVDPTRIPYCAQVEPAPSNGNCRNHVDVERGQRYMRARRLHAHACGVPARPAVRRPLTAHARPCAARRRCSRLPAPGRMSVGRPFPGSAPVKRSRPQTKRPNNLRLHFAATHLGVARGLRRVCFECRRGCPRHLGPIRRTPGARQRRPAKHAMSWWPKHATSWWWAAATARAWLSARPSQTTHKLTPDPMPEPGHLSDLEQQG